MTVTETVKIPTWFSRNHFQITWRKQKNDSWIPRSCYSKYNRTAKRELLNDESRQETDRIYPRRFGMMMTFSWQFSDYWAHSIISWAETTTKKFLLRANYEDALSVRITWKLTREFYNQKALRTIWSWAEWIFTSKWSSVFSGSQIDFLIPNKRYTKINRRYVQYTKKPRRTWIKLSLHAYKVSRRFTNRKIDNYGYKNFVFLNYENKEVRHLINNLFLSLIECLRKEMPWKVM